MTWDKYRLADALKHIVDSNREFTTWTVSTPHLLLLLKKAVEEERDKVAQWMIDRSYATGHGDTVEDLLKELEWQVADRCAEIANQAEPYQAADLIRKAFGVEK
jgi:flagellar motor switch protein FliG